MRFIELKSGYATSEQETHDASPAPPFEVVDQLRRAYREVLGTRDRMKMGQRVYDKAYFYIRHNNRKRLRQLLRKHRYLHQSDEAFLVLNAIWHNRGLLPWLLDQGVHPDSRLGKGGNTPLMQAAADGDLDTMRLLLAHGADPNLRNQENELPLGFACTWEQWEAAKLLLDHGADVNGIEDEWGTHLECAVRCKKSEGIELLRSYGGLLTEEITQVI